MNLPGKTFLRRRLFGFVAALIAVAGLSVAGVVAGANAAVVVEGDLGPALILSVPSDGTFAFTTTDLGADGRVLQFQVSSESALAAAAAQISLLDVFGIAGFGMSLIESTSGTFTTFATLDSDLVGSGGTFVVSFDSLAAGNLYGLLFTGTVTGTEGGFIAGTYTVSAVPLPPAIWLFLSALIGLAGVVRRKSTRTGAASSKGARHPA
jgi:hypothetical protein